MKVDQLFELALKAFYVHTFNRSELHSLNECAYLPARGIPTSIAEPLLAGVTIDHASWVMDATIAKENIEGP